MKVNDGLRFCWKDGLSPRKRLVPHGSGAVLFLASLEHFEENLVRRQYLMLTPQEQETPGTALGSPRPSRDMSSYEEPGYTGKMT